LQSLAATVAALDKKKKKKKKKRTRSNCRIWKKVGAVVCWR
jgi:CelD/BcsL family acetyltransferase involved in cellulose biosynthesis